jgi:hypothetical protein
VFYLQFFFVSPFRLAKIEIKDFFAVAMQFSRFFTGFESSSRTSYSLLTVLDIQLF